MRAAVIEQYGEPRNVIVIKDQPKPIPAENEVLIQVQATAVNDYDWSVVRGKPYLYRLMFGFFKPKQKIIGMELSGIIEETGSKVSKFKAGDEVYGDISGHGFGSFAEYLSIHQDAVILKPKELNFEEAAALPHAALLAWQSLIGIANIQKGQRILINGGGGGVGTLGLQLAKLYECYVTGVDSSEKHDMMVSIGFDEVLDYRKTDFTKTGEKYDIVLDCKTNRRGLGYLKALNPGGMYVTVGGRIGKLLNVLLISPFVKWFSGKRLRILGLKPNKGLEEIHDLVIGGHLKCQIDGPHPLEKTPELIQYFGEGKHLGKVIVTFN